MAGEKKALKEAEQKLKEHEPQLDEGEPVVLIAFPDMRGAVKSCDVFGSVVVAWDDGTTGHHALVDLACEGCFEDSIKQRTADAWKRGAEAMRESIIDALWGQGINVDPELLNIRAMPIPEEPAPKPLTRKERIARSLAVLREEPRIKLTPEEWRVLMEEEPEGVK